MSTIKNIIFDLGGVLLHIDPMKTIAAFDDLGMPKSIKDGALSYDHPVFLDMEQGKISDKDFRTGIKELLPSGVSDNQIDQAWCAMLLYFNEQRIEYIKELAKDYKVYLFSNTNSIHANYFEQKFFDNYQHSIHSIFEETYYSHNLGLRKPSVDAFKKVLRMANIRADETVFVDDLKNNCDAAGEIGIKNICISMDDQLVDKLKDVISA